MVDVLPTPELRIDTSVVQTSGPPSSRSSHAESAGPYLSSNARHQHYLSAPSNDSNISLISPVPSSSHNSSSSSLNLVAPTTFGSDTTIVSASGSSSKLSASEEPLPEYVLAMHDFEPQQKNATCLAFRAGQVIHVLNRDTSGWWDGELEGKRGWFPSNYVNGDLGVLAEDVMAVPKPDVRPSHSKSRSTVSVSSHVSRTSSRQGAFSRNDYCPPLMVPLLHALSLLQNSVRSNRTEHFQPSVACIIACVRSILQAADCLSRDAPLLKRYTALSQERRRVLSELAAIVQQAKKASSKDALSEDARDAEIEQMVRLGGQVFSRVRRFLAIAVQCGVDLPDRFPEDEENALFSASSFSTEPRRHHSSMTTTPASAKEDDISKTNPWRATTSGLPRAKMRARDRPGTPGSKRAKSVGDLRTQHKSLVDPDAGPVPAISHSKLEELKAASDMRINGHKHTMSSSSTSSYSSVDSVTTPITPPFPSGPSSYEQLTEALRHTHDQYLSTIAAFIGHAHSHSRTSHASSTGHMYELVREIVELVCKLLTIVEAVLRHPGIPPAKMTKLRVAKEGLYSVTSSLADSVRMLTGALPSNMTEEQEKAALIRSATNALKAGSDCSTAVKMCLNRNIGDGPFIVELPKPQEYDRNALDHEPLNGKPMARVSARFSKTLRKSSSAMTLASPSGDADEEDREATIKQRPPLPPIDTHRFSTKTVTQSTPEPPLVRDETEETGSPITFQNSGPISMPVTPLSPTSAGIDSYFPLSVPRRSEDREMAWETENDKAAAHERQRSLEEKILNGDLPSVPDSAVAMTNEGEPRRSESSTTSRSVPEPDTERNPTSTSANWMVAHDYSVEDVSYNSEGVLTGATIPALVEKMTPHASIVDPAFSSVFYLTFRLFTTPVELAEALINRYNLLPPPDLQGENLYLWMQQKGVPVRLRVSNVIRQWLETYWRPGVDDAVLPILLDFNSKALAVMFPGPSARINEMITTRMHQASSSTVDPLMASPRMDRIRDAGMALNPPTPITQSPSEIPRPVMTKTLLSQLRNKSFSSIYITDFDSVELARQLTIMECNLYCAIMPEEMLESGQDKEGVKPAVNVKAVSSLSTAITGWVAESILNESDAKKRTTLVKFFIKVADRCTTLNNFSTSRSILAALDSSTIARLHQTWTGVPQKQKLQLDTIRKLADHARNYREYRTRLRNTAPPAVPFLGLYLTDLTFCREGNPSHRASPLAQDKKLLNFNKYHKMARIVQDMQRFQVPYNLKEIPEVQAYLCQAFENAKHHGDLQDLYRRSLLVEPKMPADTPPPQPSGDVSKLFNWTVRDRSGSHAGNSAA